MVGGGDAMSWQQVYAHVDEDALAVWGNPGLLRRAKKALAAGEVSILNMDDSAVLLQNDDAHITLTQGGLNQASCNCPAAGACKHIIAAVLCLQQQFKSLQDGCAESTDYVETIAASSPQASTDLNPSHDGNVSSNTTIPSWLNTYAYVDDDALSVWGNAGLLRRARKAVEAGEVMLLELGEKEGHWQNDEAVVSLNAAGLTQASCNCPAAGACKHIIAAVLAAQQQLAQVAAVEGAETGVNTNAIESAPNQIASNGDDETSASVALAEALNAHSLNLGKIGKVQWRQAYALWAAWQQQDPPRINIQARKILFQTDLSTDAVVYLAGGGFAGMLSSIEKKRQLVVHLALMAHLWQQQGQVFSWPEEVLPTENEDEGLLSEEEQSLLILLQQACERVLKLGLNHLMPNEAQQWHWLQLSARVERLPRLAGMLRRLAGEVRLLSEKHINSDSSSTLHSVARLAAYIDALQHANREQLPLLRGQLRRQYQTQSDSMTLLPLGAQWWQGEGGASGLNVYVWSVEEQAIMVTAQARSNANDTSFNRYSAWHGVGFWNRSAEQIMRQQTILPEPRIIGDRLANTVSKPSQAQELSADYYLPALTPMADLPQQSIELTTPFLLKVTDYEPLYLDELEQRLQWLVYDRDSGFAAQLSLDITDSTRVRAEQLQWLCEKELPIVAVLVLARLDEQQVVLEALSVIRPQQSQFLWCLDYHSVSPKQYYWTRKPAKPKLLQANLAASSNDHWLERLCAPVWRLVEARSASGMRAWGDIEREQLQAAIAQAKALGLTVLVQAWQRLAEDAKVQNVLQSVHLMQLARQGQQQWPVFELPNEQEPESVGNEA